MARLGYAAPDPEWPWKELDLAGSDWLPGNLPNLTSSYIYECSVRESNGFILVFTYGDGSNDDLDDQWYFILQTVEQYTKSGERVGGLTLRVDYYHQGDVPEYETRKWSGYGPDWGFEFSGAGSGGDYDYFSPNGTLNVRDDKRFVVHSKFQYGNNEPNYDFEWLHMSGTHYWVVEATPDGPVVADYQFYQWNADNITDHSLKVIPGTGTCVATFGSGAVIHPDWQNRGGLNGLFGPPDDGTSWNTPPNEYPWFPFNGIGTFLVDTDGQMTPMNMLFGYWGPESNASDRGQWGVAVIQDDNSMKLFDFSPTYDDDDPDYPGYGTIEVIVNEDGTFRSSTWHPALAPPSSDPYADEYGTVWGWRYSQAGRWGDFQVDSEGRTLGGFGFGWTIYSGIFAMNPDQALYAWDDLGPLDEDNHLTTTRKVPMVPGATDTVLPPANLVTQKGVSQTSVGININDMEPVIQWGNRGPNTLQAVRVGSSPTCVFVGEGYYARHWFYIIGPASDPGWESPKGEFFHDPSYVSYSYVEQKWQTVDADALGPFVGEQFTMPTWHPTLNRVISSIGIGDGTSMVPIVGCGESTFNQDHAGLHYNWVAFQEPPLRMVQRNDTLSLVDGSGPRIGAVNNHPSSRQASKAPRLGSAGGPVQGGQAYL